MPENNGWNEWSKFVLKELESLNSKYETLNGKIDNLREDVIILKVKAGFFGVMGGLVITIGVEVVKRIV